MAKRGWHRSFRVLQRAGVNILPHHFYSGVPDIADLERRNDWRKPRSMHGILARSMDEQVALLGEWLVPVGDYLRQHSLHRESFGGGDDGGGYGEIEADVLFGFVAANKPRRITQIGCGVSTAICLRAADHAQYKPDILCLEPYPSAYLRDAETKGLIRLIGKPAQMVDYETIADLDAGDMLFIDSTHAVRPGSEVNYLIHEVLPRLKAGVWVHFHDIYFPYDYARDTLDGDMLFPQESTLLYAFLTGNERFGIEASLSMVHYGRPDALRALLPKYEPNGQVDGLRTDSGRHFPSSAYLLAHP